MNIRMKKIAISLLAVCLTFSVLWAQETGNDAVLLRSGIVLLPDNAAQFDRADVLYETEVAGDKFYRLIQFGQIPTADQHRLIEATGIQLLDYLPHKAYIAALPTSISSGQLVAAGIRSIMPIPQHLKLDENLRYRPFPEWALNKDKVEVILKYYASIPGEDVLAFCRADGIEVIRHNGINNFLYAAVGQDQLEAISRLPYVSYLELRPEPGEPDDTPGRGLHRANAIDVEFPSGRHYTGKDVKVLVRDDGFVGPHIDFQGRISQDVGGDGAINHADGVAGIFAGAGNRDPRMRGMASGAFVYVIDYQADFLDNTLPLHIDNDVLVTNSSYSNGCNTGYTLSAQTVDQQLYDYPTFMHVFSAGNSNNQNCNYGAGNQWGNITGGHKQAKNSIATANLFADASLVNSSSRGPAYDGRIKPDIAANGQDQISTDPFHQYDPFGGTSAAAPGIAGITAMLHQAYSDHNPGEIAEGALLKAILLNTANDLGNVGPDFRYGWGHVNALRAAMTIEEERYFSGTVNQGEAVTHQIEIPDGVVEARIMVYWSDPEASELAAKALINDLDIEVTDANGAVYMPWLLDPTPDPGILNSPATTGVDTLNNVEQVALTNPAAGTYTLKVNGTEVPFGNHKYWVVYEFRTNDITLTYPFGGEGLAPGETERIHWDDAGNQGFFIVEYSTNGGSSWSVIGTFSGDARMINWTVPNTATGKAYVRVTRDGLSSQNAEPFSIVEVPANLEVAQACPNFIRLEWDAVPGATSYDVFLLGDLYMDSIGTTAELFYDVPAINANPTLDHWLSVRAVGDDGLRGRRAVAIQYNDGLLNCPLDNDMALNQITSPNLALSSCGDLDVEVSIEIFNNGAGDATDVQVSYQFGPNTPVTETVPGPIPPGSTLAYTFSTPTTLSGPGLLDLKAWVSTTAADEAAFNDTITQVISSVIYPGAGEPIGLTEDFEGDVIPPPYWQVQNPDNGITFVPRQVTGSDGQTTTAMQLNNFDNGNIGDEDALVSVPIDLTGATANTLLSFDLAYAVYNLNQYWDALRVDVYTDCGTTFAGTIYYKEKDVLATVPPQTSAFSPSQAFHWRKETASLADFAGESVVVHFVNITGYGNNLYIDNVNVENVAPPVGGISASLTEGCQGFQSIFQDNSQGDILSYTWNFGAGATPSQKTGPGPHIVKFNEPGTVTVTLIVSNGVLSDTVYQTIEVAPQPVASYDYATVNGIVTFTNNSQFGTSYSWNFGDGNASIAENPVHVFQSSGTFNVTLTATNECGSTTSSQLVTVVVSSVAEQMLEQAVSILPNPNEGRFEVVLEGLQSPSVELSVLDATGRRLWTAGYEMSGNFRKVVDLEEASPGVYWLLVRTDQAASAFKVVVQ